MKKIGFLLLISGFLVAAYSTALDTVSVNWVMYAVAAFAAITGVFLIRKHERGTAKSATVLSANRAELSDSLQKIVSNLEDMTEEESQPLLDTLHAAATRPENVYRHHWRVGDVVMWDNRCAMHYAVMDYTEDMARLLHRTTAGGEVPR